MSTIGQQTSFKCDLEELVDPTNRAGTAYVLKINSGYKVVGITYGAGGAYERLKGSPPTTFIQYQDRAGEGKFIWQMDEFVQQGELTRAFE